MSVEAFELYDYDHLRNISEGSCLLQGVRLRFHIEGITVKLLTLAQVLRTPQLGRIEVTRYSEVHIMKLN